MGTFDIYNPLDNVNVILNEEQLIEISEWFAKTSKPRLVINNDDPVNVVTIDNLKKFLELKKFHRRSFHYPSYGEIMEEADKLKAGVTRMLMKDQLIYMLNKWVLLPSLKHELKLAYKVFDTEKRNFLDIEELKVIVNAYGDVFNESETLEFLRDANVSGNGNVFYEEFVESLFSLAPELNEIKAEYLYEDPDEDPSVPPEPEPEPEVPPPAAPPPPPPPPPKKAKK